MYAVIKTGGKQYRVEEGDVVRIEKIEVATGESVDFDQVLLVANGDDVKVGQPMLDGAKVTAEVLEQGRHKKIKIVKFRRRKHPVSNRVTVSGTRGENHRDPGLILKTFSH